MFTVADVCKRLGVAPSTIYSAVEEGLIECYRIKARRGTKGTIRFTEEHVQAYLEASKVARGASAPPASTGTFTHLDGERLQKAWKERGAL